MITNEQRLVRVTGRSGVEIPHWDNGLGPLWVFRESLGISGVVRATTWESAYDCVIDEIMADADPDDPENYVQNPMGEDELAEGVHWRCNGVPSAPHLNSPLAQEDLNGCLLEELTPELAEELGIVVEVEEN